MHVSNPNGTSYFKVRVDLILADSIYDGLQRFYPDLAARLSSQIEMALADLVGIMEARRIELELDAQGVFSSPPSERVSA